MGQCGVHSEKKLAGVYIFTRVQAHITFSHKRGLRNSGENIRTMVVATSVAPKRAFKQNLNLFLMDNRQSTTYHCLTYFMLSVVKKIFWLLDKFFDFYKNVYRSASPFRNKTYFIGRSYLMEKHVPLILTSARLSIDGFKTGNYGTLKVTAPEVR